YGRALISFQGFGFQVKDSQSDQIKKLQQDQCRRSIDEGRIKEFWLFYLLKKADRHTAPALRERNPPFVNLHSSFVIPNSSYKPS
ncbi:MAG: hypothetical protein PVF37_22100, partial [Desulfobacterales bacterium]